MTKDDKPDLQKVAVAAAAMPTPILDLFVGSIEEAIERLSPVQALAQWCCLSKASQPQVLTRLATEEAFTSADPIDRQAWERILSGFHGHRESLPEHSFLALVNDQPVGSCLISMRHYYSSWQPYPYVDLVAVSPKMQKSGLGTALMAQALHSLHRCGHRSVVHAHIRRGNQASENLFTSLGFLRWRRDD